MAHGPREKPLDFEGNPDHITLGLGLRYGYSYGGGTATPCMGGYNYVTWCLFDSNNFGTAGALEED